VQSTLGVRKVEPVSGRVVAETLQALADDVAFAGIKIGMLATAEICETVAALLDQLPAVPVVLDPVLRSSSSRRLLEAAGIRAMQEKLLRRVNWITPNLAELEILTGKPVACHEDVPQAAAKLRREARDLGNEALHIVVTGGHLDRPDDYLLTAAGESTWIPGERVATNATHGTGCAFSSALLCRLVAGDSPLDAAANAKAYVAAALRAAYPIGRGKGPMHHLYRFDTESDA
jgi:hydroxymethylpyrimidine/phosphomethylpyrimidine kinase